MKTGYSIKTWKMRLFCPEKQMIETTEALYRDAVAFYYELLKEREELWAENLLTIQGYLEKLTVPGRDGREPKYIPPGGKLPVYFRRSAMNKAAMAVKTAASAESFPEKIDANITFFKGMYKDLTDTSVVLNGIKLINCYGEKMPEETLLLIEDYLDGKLHVFDKDWPELPFASRDHVGCTVDYVAGRNRYMGYLISLGIYSFRGVKVGLDCANGSSLVMPRLLSVISMFTSIW